MTGIEILVTEQVAVEFGMNWVWFFVVGGITAIFFGVFFWALVCGANTNPLAIILPIVIGLLLGGFFGAASGLSEEHAIPTSYETHYQVTISNDVNFNEFSEYYEIIDQNGKIYTVKEKN